MPHNRRTQLTLAVLTAFTVILSGQAVLAGPASAAARVKAPKPAPSLTTSPSPTTSPSFGPAVARHAGNTGVPAGTVLRPSGPLVITTPGAVVDGLDIDGCVSVKADNVILRNTRITCPGTSGSLSWPIRLTSGFRNLLVHDVEIDGGGVTSVAVCCSEYTLLRVNIHNVVDGPRLSNNTAVLDSYIHHLARVAGSHNDTLQTTGGRGILVRGNTLDVYRPDTNDPFNAGFMLGSTTAAFVADVLVEDNRFNGGNYTVNFRSDMAAENVVFRRNVFGRDCRYGGVSPTVPGVDFQSTNVWEHNGTAVKGASGVCLWRSS